MPPIPQFSVIRIPFDFRDGDGLVKKRFVVLGYAGSAVICVKTTSKIDRFSRYDGVVYYASGDCAVFESDTVVDPANCFAIQSSQLDSYARSGQFENLGCLEGFREPFLKAVKENVTLEPKRRNGLLKLLQTH